MTTAAVTAYVLNQQPLRQLLGLPATQPASTALRVNNRPSTSHLGSTSDPGQAAAEGANEGVHVAELSGGKINFVWLVTRGPRGFVLKYAAPYVRAVPSFALSQGRLAVEARAMAAAHAASPRHVPALLLHDPSACVLVSELLTPGPQPPTAEDRPATAPTAPTEATAVGLVKLVKALTLAPPHERLSSDLAELLYNYLATNCRHVMTPDRHAAEAEAMANQEVVAANAAVVLTDPWDQACARVRVPPHLEERVRALRSDPGGPRAEAARLLALYRSSREALIHNDLTAGNVLVPDPSLGAAGKGGESGRTGGSGGSGSSSECGRTFLIDWEFATYGPPAYDIGSLIGNLLLSYCALCFAPGGDSSGSNSCATVGNTVGTSGNGGIHGGLVGREALLAAAEARVRGAAPVLQCAAEVWEQLAARLAAGGEGGVDGGGWRADAAYLERLWEDSLGFAGCVVARLTWGMLHYPALEELPDTCWVPLEGSGQAGSVTEAASARAQADSSSAARGGVPSPRAAAQSLAVDVAEALLTPARRAAWRGAGGSSGGGARALVAEVESLALRAAAAAAVGEEVV
ncbi:hypothetical protein HYH03_009658 [Edaphochlamys debaryana]|uniref:Aminoglycoside phosphotransferase domain-containing protein n=1 Tax=Edaphochlamys debaryana TaxID=47281 RepID=A0A836BY49_9CHLO|nr:hypothetical protein HYH03_009658 [Edaphochlamys debaryana]|eukprot:KAG2491923.1 hypothetical protein HYH03_009658 [Edaphochlamys debaryana]